MLERLRRWLPRGGRETFQLRLHNNKQLMFPSQVHGMTILYCFHVYPYFELEMRVELEGLCFELVFELGVFELDF